MKKITSNKKNMIRRVLGHFWHEMRDRRLGWIGVFVVVVVVSILDKAIAVVLFSQIIDLTASVYTQNTEMQPIYHAIALLVIVRLVDFILRRVNQFYLLKFLAEKVRDLNNRTFSTLLKRSMHYFNTTFSGALVARTRRYTRAFETIIGRFNYVFLRLFTELTVSLIVLFSVAPLLGYLLLGWTIVFLVFAAIFLRLKYTQDIRKAKADSRLTAGLADSMSNMQAVKIFSAEEREELDYNVATRNEYQARWDSWRTVFSSDTVSGILVWVLIGGGMVVSVFLWQRGVITPGTIALVQVFSLSISRSIWRLSDASMKVFEAITDASEMINIFDAPLIMSDSLDPEDAHMNEGALVFDAVDFAYTDGQSVFEDFNLNIPAGQHVGLVGHSGSGKSTITSLILRFVDVNAGSITIDDQDIRDVRQSDLRRHISYVPQDPVLFHRTIRENIAYGNPGASQKEIIDAAKKARAHEFIMELPQQYDTMVGERGVKLSGGQRQRIAIARVMLEDAPLLILDEATSSLDTISEKYIKEAFDAAMHNRTTIVVAHRLSTIANLDRIIVLEKGEVIQDGNHDELIKKKGVYRDMWNEQVN